MQHRERQAIDQRPGSLPDIRSELCGITFTMVPVGIPKEEPLVIRCDTDGEIWVSIGPRTPPSG